MQTTDLPTFVKVLTATAAASAVTSGPNNLPLFEQVEIAT